LSSIRRTDISGFADRWLSQLSQLSHSAAGEAREAPETAAEAESQSSPSVQPVFTREKKEKEVQIVRESEAAKAAKPAKVVTRLDVYKAERAAMWRDLTVVVQDLLAEGRKPGQIRRTFGLTWGEIERIRQAPR